MPPSPTTHREAFASTTSAASSLPAGPYITVKSPEAPSPDPSHGQGDQRQLADPDGAEQKKARACEACRGLKVRCDPGPDGDDGPCKRCHKAGRDCVVTLPTRKRQKKTDSRVAELEKKIDLLTASLQARAPPASAASAPKLTATTNTAPTSATATPSIGGASSPSLTTHETPTTSAGSMPNALRRPPPLAVDEAGAYRGGWAPNPPGRWGLSTPLPAKPAFSPNPAAPPPPSRETHSPSFQPPMVMAGQKRKSCSTRGDTADDDRGRSPSRAAAAAAAATAPATLLTKSIEGDVVDRGLMSMDLAGELFARYNVDMVPHLPAILFPPAMTVAELRKTKPILFLAVMAVASFEHHGLQRTLQREMMQLFAEKVFLSGDKSLELVHALLVSVIWYWPPENFEELKFYQLVHMAAVMAIDIGLGKKTTGRRRVPLHPFTWRDHPFRRQPPLDPTTLECRRTWLVCHFLCANTAVALRRPHLVRWTPFMTESVDVLQTSPDAAPTDKYFCHLIWTHRMAEEIGGNLMTEDEDYTATITDLRVQHSLKAMERDLRKYRAAVPEDLMQPTLSISFNFINLYMHELALRTDTVADQWRPPFNTENLTDGLMNPGPLSSAHVKALSACLDSVTGIFNAFLAMPVPTIRNLPVYNFVRVAYAVVVLLKMYFSVSSPQLDIRDVIDNRDMRVDYYFVALLDKFRAAATDDKCRPAAKFLVVLAMLRTWFLKQDHADAAKDDPAKPGFDHPKLDVVPRNQPSSASPNNEARTQRYRQQQQQQPNTPLHLLSEIATSGASCATTPIPPLHPGLPALRQQPPQPFFADNSSLETAQPSNSRRTQAPPPIASHRSDTMAPAFPAVTASSSSSSSWLPQALPTDVGLGLGGGVGNGGFDSLGLDQGPYIPQEVNDETYRLFMSVSDPWLTDVMQGLPDTDLFPL
ncbi:hypothetical protein S40285_01892 [Stachybotrys chlorohalonatus IBT 40285]|uniref:Zn(2)-C6 fungal-type domain-containing protein n=1 Tax=Stachybotrys chlorohalonatus (strain IBT 40285) TaxID=1283841 RepID=A0A084QQP8_STAC4|nr:hypothetical protein S40285_01892 [Stachybotrys chlorohalonata IBT 40285]